MKFIEISTGALAIVDNDDYERLNKQKWSGSKNGLTTYAVCGKSHKTIYMHHLVLPRLKGKETHHINHDGLDNRKCNLYRLTHKEHTQFIRSTKYQKPNRRTL